MNRRRAQKCTWTACIVLFATVCTGLAVVGTATWIERAAAPDSNNRAAELDCLARSVYYKSRGAFSWTNDESLKAPCGFEWWRARAVAHTVHDNYASPYVGDALFYDATYVSPRWAHTRPQVALIGRHFFFR